VENIKRYVSQWKMLFLGSEKQSNSVDAIVD